MEDMYNYITLNSALGILGVLTVLLLTVIAYSVYLSKQYQAHLEDHEIYSDKLRYILAADNEAIPEDFFDDDVSQKHRIRILVRYIQKHCLSERHPHIDRLRDFALSIGLTDHLRKLSLGRDSAKSALGLRLLAEIGDKSDVDIFKHILDTGKSSHTVFAAAIGLAHYNVTDSIREIVEKLYDPEHPNRDMVLSVMSTYDDSAIVPIMDLISDHDSVPSVKGALIDFLGVRKAVAAKPLLENILKSSSDSELNLHIIEALEKVGDSDSCAIIEPCLKDSDFRVRLKAVNALERLAKDKYIVDTEEMLKDPDLFVRRNAAEAMSRMGPAAMQRLNDLTKSDNRDISIITKLVLAEHKYGKIRWRFRYGDSIA